MGGQKPEVQTKTKLVIKLHYNILADRVAASGRLEERNTPSQLSYAIKGKQSPL